MDVFSLDEFVINQYENFSRSFTKIKSPEIKLKVDDLYNDKRFWPEPLLQINPHYAAGNSIQNLIKDGELEPDCAGIFHDKRGLADKTDPTLKLHKHQEQAISFAKGHQSYVVTTGTGSGKSLCFFIPIIDEVLKSKKNEGGKKTSAIVIYPMNALVNSQVKELESYLGPVTDSQVTYARYTSQDDQKAREHIRANPPDILLTNFMMLEMLMTRQDKMDRDVLKNCEGLQFIVLDELHTYRGRQGADVAMLIRRLRSRIGCPDNPPLCIGTSATMASEGEESEKNEAVSRIASQIFGVKIGPDAIVTETLKRVTNPRKIGDSSLAGLREAVEDAAKGDVANGRINDVFFDDPLAIWVETRIGLKNMEKKLERAKPISLKEAADALSKDCELSYKNCEQALKNALIGFSIPEKERVSGSNEHASLFAFKLHQFVAGAGRLYTTLHPEGEREVTFSGQIFNPNNAKDRLYPVHFCRSCGQEFHPVTLRKHGDLEIFEKREIDDIPVEGDEDDEGADWGYLMPEPADNDFPFSGKATDYPDAWIEKKPDGMIRLKNTYKKKQGQQYSIKPDGNTDIGAHKAWFFPGKFRYCPSCRHVINSSARDINKLASLTAESRSSATTILLTSVLSWMNDPRSTISEHSRKFLAFTDNRQDAALQAGHFNDFIFVTMLRGAILAALESSENGLLDEASIGQEVQKALGFLAGTEFHDRAVEWLVNEDLKGQGRVDAESLLRQNLQHLFWIDQRRSWRYTNPNLEQLGLLVADYKYLDETAANNDEFIESKILKDASHEERRAALKVLYDHMRKGLAVDCAVLESSKLEILAGKSSNVIKSPWYVNAENLTTSAIFMTTPPKSKNIRNKDEDKLIRGTSTSAIGRKIRELTFGGRHIENKEVPEVIECLLKSSENYGSVTKLSSQFGGMGWKLAGSTIQFRRGDLDETGDSSNMFFVEIYQKISDLLASGGQTLFGFEGREHTAQVEGALRELREMRFRYEQEDQNALADKKDILKGFTENNRFLPTIFCSPTMELGVDISAMNVVYLRNAPPTAANYAQRSGRAGRSGHSALILTYCAARSPHDQYFFDRKNELVDGVVAPPSIDIKNRDLVESHLNAEWLAALSMILVEKKIDLKPNINMNLDLESQDKVLRPEINDAVHSAKTSAKAKQLIDGVLTALEKDYAGDLPPWFAAKDLVADDILSKAPARFNAAFDRWRDLLRAAELSIELSAQKLKDYTISSMSRKSAVNRQRVGESQRAILLSDQSHQDTDFYLYRYLATEGFLPGYNFPRLPLMAYVQGGRDGKNQRYIQRARFMAISEFGPQSLVYHEGQAFRVDRALLKDASNRDDGNLSTKSRALCPSCGASHEGEHPECCHVCNAPLSGALPITNLYRIENVGTRPVERITSNDEERKRQGFEIQTTFSFDTSSYVASQTVSDNDGDIFKIDYAQAAYISRINKGLRRRKDLSQIGFYIDPKTGSWIGQQKDDGSENARPDQQRQNIVPLVEDRKNALLIRFNQTWLTKLGEQRAKTLATLQHALARGIEAVYQLEEGEILVEPTPSRSERNALLFYESAEGGAGVLDQILSDKDGLTKIAKKALEIMHFDPLSFDAAWKDISKLTHKLDVDCVAGCYHCVLSYFNQPDHEDIDRRDTSMQEILLRLANRTISTPINNSLMPNRNQGTVLKGLEGNGEAWDGLPAVDDKPLTVAGINITNVWRQKRIVLLSEHELNDNLRQALEAKGVRYFVFSSDTTQAGDVFKRLKTALQE